MKKKRLWQITSSYFCAGLSSVEEIVVEAAPIIGWMYGKKMQYIHMYCSKKDWKIVEVFLEPTHGQQ